MKQLKPYSQEVEDQMSNLYQSLTEKDRRRYAAVEAKKLGYGGISYLCRILQCDEGTIKHGLQEIAKPLPSNDGTIRKKGQGVKA